MNEKENLCKGIEVIKVYIATLPKAAGVYRMLSENDEVLYVGKAKELKKRVTSYTFVDKLPLRLQKMVSQTRRMEFIRTQTETEALLLEANLIKKLKPRFNILLRDDKSFPYILLCADHDFPKLIKHRGAKSIKGQYFGPFASARDVNQTITILQRVFMLRNCTDNSFAQRKRPCLQYNIKRCTAPCVGKVSIEDYKNQVDGVIDFMIAKSREIQKDLTALMQAASDVMDYEKAASYRNRIRALASIHSHQDINTLALDDADIFAIFQMQGKSCVQIFFFRGGHNFGNKSYFPLHQSGEKEEDILFAFISQFYLGKPVPKEIIISHDLPEKQLLKLALSSIAKCHVSIEFPKRGKRKKLLDFALINAKESLERQIAATQSQSSILAATADLFGIKNPIKRIEVYDNSHISGTNMVGAMIVATQEGFQKNSYRIFNIKKVTASDDFGMMREVFSRRFKNSANYKGEGILEDWPDLILIDGGKGQLNSCYKILEDFGVFDKLNLVAISKGPDRNSGREKFHVMGMDEFQLSENDSILHYLQRLRDEAHRFAIGTHRKKRKKQIKFSFLDEIDGIGAKRKKALLLFFGSAKAVASAAVEDIRKVEGISHSMAQKIYDHFHS